MFSQNGFLFALYTRWEIKLNGFHLQVVAAMSARKNKFVLSTWNPRTEVGITAKWNLLSFFLIPTIGQSGQYSSTPNLLKPQQWEHAAPTPRATSRPSPRGSSQQSHCSPNRPLWMTNFYLCSSRTIFTHLPRAFAAHGPHFRYSSSNLYGSQPPAERPARAWHLLFFLLMSQATCYLQVTTNLEPEKTIDQFSVDSGQWLFSQLK